MNSVGLSVKENYLEITNSFMTYVSVKPTFLENGDYII